MKIIYSSKEKLHHPQYEWNFGKLVPYPEKNIRAQLIKNEAIKRGMKSMVINPNEYPLKHIKKVTDPKMVDYIKSCEQLKPGESVFPHVFGYRDFTPQFKSHPRINLKKAGFYCFDVGIELDQHTFTAAKASADVALTGADLLLKGKEKYVFSLCRPPGHHAGYDHFGGYCIFCNAAIAAQYLSVAGRVAILDIDFHHGNGTQGIFYDSDNVLYVSIHGDPERSYPYFSGFADEKGERLGLGANLNIPLPAGVGDTEYRKYFYKALRKVESFAPKYLIVSVGLDIYKDDPLSDIGVTSPFFKELGKTVCKLGIPVLGLLEGGYDMSSLAENGANFIEGMAESD
jgi:acetoin utilization deacetylase AcuC-like enzyme